MGSKAEEEHISYGGNRLVARSLEEDVKRSERAYQTKRKKQLFLLL